MSRPQRQFFENMKPQQLQSLLALKSMSQICTLETLIGRKSAILRRTLIGSRALYSDHVLLLLGSLFSVELMSVRLLWFCLASSVFSTSR